jgi:hypothetical protein
MLSAYNLSGSSFLAATKLAKYKSFDLKINQFFFSNFERLERQEGSQKM